MSVKRDSEGLIRPQELPGDASAAKPKQMFDYQITLSSRNLSTLEISKGKLLTAAKNANASVKGPRRMVQSIQRIHLSELEYFRVHRCAFYLHGTCELLKTVTGIALEQEVKIEVIECSFPRPNISMLEPLSCGLLGIITNRS